MDRARELDQQDELAKFRELFHIPLARNSYHESDVTDDRECIYFNGNSLGCMVCVILQSIYINNVLILIAKKGSGCDRSSYGGLED